MFLLAVASASPLSIPPKGERSHLPKRIRPLARAEGRIRKLVALCLRAKATSRIRQLGTSHIARSSGAAAGRVSNDEALPAAYDSHVQQSVPAARGWTANHAGLLDLLARDSAHCSISRPSDGNSWTVTGSTVTEIKLRAACGEGERSQPAQPSLALPNLAPARRASPACEGCFSRQGLAS